MAVTTLSFTIIFKLTEKEVVSTNFYHPALFPVILSILGFVMLRYFVDLQKQITINARKVVTLRTLLGLDYGNIQLTLPNWRVEGANNPFSIRYFEGWFSFKSMPFWLITISINFIWYIGIRATSSFEIFNYHFSWNLVIPIVSIIYWYTFRTNLFDRYETIYLLFVKSICFILRIRLLDNFEYILYRSKLAYLELDRLNVDFSQLEKMLIEIEDQTFMIHNGISIRSIARGVASRLVYFRKKHNLLKHGGSTLNMQLCRTLFIPTNQNKYLRKVGEILLSIWLNSNFEKKELLKIYIASVRYDKGIIGLSKAIPHFLGNLNGKLLCPEEAFFLVERLSNVSSTVNWDRVNYLQKRLSQSLDSSTLKELYWTNVRNRKLQVI